jgi:hypothetical protein
MTVPSIKGSALRSLVEDVKQQLERGTASPAELRILGDEERRLVDEGILDSGWYPLSSYEKLTRFMQRTEGKGDPDYVRRRGAAVAERLISLGVYQQVDFLGRTGKAESLDQAVATLRLVATMWNGFFNVGRWEVYRDDAANTYGLTVTDAQDLPDVACEAAHGLIARLSRETGSSADEVTMERPSPDVVRYTLRFVP